MTGVVCSEDVVLLSSVVLEECAVAVGSLRGAEGVRNSCLAVATLSILMLSGSESRVGC